MVSSGPGALQAPSGHSRLLPWVSSHGRLTLVLEITSEEFEALVADALDRVPSDLAALMDNVVVFVEDEAPPDDPHLLGLYDGIPLTERGSGYLGVDLLPDHITIFRRPILRMCHDRDDVVQEVLVTVVHEIAHHFGIDDERLHELGWG